MRSSRSGGGDRGSNLLCRVYHMPVDSEHKGKQLRLWSFMPPHMLSFQVNWCAPVQREACWRVVRQLCYCTSRLSTASSHLTSPSVQHRLAFFTSFLSTFAAAPLISSELTLISLCAPLSSMALSAIKA